MLPGRVTSLTQRQACLHLLTLFYHSVPPISHLRLSPLWPGPWCTLLVKPSDLHGVLLAFANDQRASDTFLHPFPLLDL